MNEKLLRIEFAKLCALLLSVKLRQSRIIEVLSVLVKPFEKLLNILSEYRRDVLQRLKYNGQKCRLEYCLNYIFGDRKEIHNLKYKRRILVLDSERPESPPYIIYRRGVEIVYDKPKRRGTYGQVILNKRGVNSREWPAFIVEPYEIADIKNVQDELVAVTNYYKTQGKAWELQFRNDKN